MVLFFFYSSALSFLDCFLMSLNALSCTLLCWLVFFSFFEMLGLSEISFWTTLLPPPAVHCWDNQVWYFHPSTTCWWPQGPGPDITSMLSSRQIFLTSPETCLCVVAQAPRSLWWMWGIGIQHSFQPSPCMLFITSEAGAVCCIFQGVNHCPYIRRNGAIFGKWEEGGRTRCCFGCHWR